MKTTLLRRARLALAVGLLVAVPSSAWGAAGANIVGLIGGSAGSSDVQAWAVAPYFPAPGVPMVATILNIGKMAARGERPSDTWLYSSYVFSGVGIAAGGASIGVALDTSDQVNMALGIGMIAFSAANLAITIWGHSQPAARQREVADRGGVTIVPIFGKKRDGGVFAGIGLRLMSF